MGRVVQVPRVLIQSLEGRRRPVGVRVTQEEGF